MHDPDSLVIEILGIVSIWHHDPCKDGTDDSCGWFKRARHGDKEVLKRIISRYDFDWDRVFESENKTYLSGWFSPEGQPVLSPMGIALNMFWLASYEHFKKNRNKANRFCQRNLFDILHFTENNTDSIFQDITCKYGIEKREERIRSMASCIYGFILRKERKFYDHPRFHFWHYRLSFPIYYRIKNMFVKDNQANCVGKEMPHDPQK